MSIPSYGAMPLSRMFLLVRILQTLCMIIIIGITSNFVNMIVITGVEPPQEIVGTLSVACIATLYIMVSIGYYWSYANLGLLIMTTVDSLLLIAFIVCAVTLGKPLTYLNCYIIGRASSQIETQYAYAFVTATTKNLNIVGSNLDLLHWSGVTQSSCFQAKTVWGVSIALCVLFTTSSTLLPTLWYKNKKATPAHKSVEEA